MTRINWTLNVQVADGPKLAANKYTEVEAYDKVDVACPKVPSEGPAVETTIELQPGAVAGQVRFLMVTADRYENLAYKVNATTGTSFALDGPHLLIGVGAVKLLDAVPSKLLVTNSDASNDNAVHVLVGRDATP